MALGTLTFGREPDEATSARILHTYLDAGGSLLDTADAYGWSEEVLGPLLDGVRDAVMVASKVGLPTRPGPNTEGASRVRLLRQVEETLRRLRTDWLDIYYVHAWDPITPLDEMLGTLDSLVLSGKVRYLGLSNFFAWQIATAVGRAALRGWELPAVVTAEYSLVERGVERDIQGLCRHTKGWPSCRRARWAAACCRASTAPVRTPPPGRVRGPGPTAGPMYGVTWPTSATRRSPTRSDRSPSESAARRRRWR